MTLKSKVFLGVAAVLAVTLTAMGLISLTTPTNCGKNSYALDVCSTFALSAYVAGLDNGGQFEITKMDKYCLPSIARPSWGICGTDLLVKTNFPAGKVNNHKLVIVCTRQFENVPQPTIWNFYHKNPAHAAGYSDGTTGLISPTEFKSLNLSGFTSVSNLVANIEPGPTN